MPAIDDICRLELKVRDLGGGRISQRLVFAGTDIEPGHQVYTFHEKVCATGYQVKVKTGKISEMAAAGHPMYGVVVAIEGEGVTVEELRTSPNDPPEGQNRQVRFERQFFLDNYEVD